MTRSGGRPQQASLFPMGEDLPLFSGTPIPAVDAPFVERTQVRQPRLPGLPPVEIAWRQWSVENTEEERP